MFRLVRRERDSNPRYAFLHVHPLSRRAPSTTRTPLLVCPFARKVHEGQLKYKMEILVAIKKSDLHNFRFFVMQHFINFLDAQVCLTLDLVLGLKLHVFGKFKF